jgi:SAM-dependent methyltransferase
MVSNSIREEKLLSWVDKDGRGLEIGPGHSPVAPKKQGYNVQIIDYIGKEELIDKYRNIDADKYGGVKTPVENIEEVDFVWSGESYSELTGKKKYYDWIIASHMIEHTPDLIKFINQCDEILKDDGVLSLAIPDKRYCFDRFRPITGISKIVDAHLAGVTNHSMGTAVEYYLSVVSKGGKSGWNQLHQGEYEFIHDIEEVRDIMETIRESDEYHDFHSWCFTPSSFRLLINDLNLLGFISLKEMDSGFSHGLEFFQTLSKKGGISVDRMQLVQQMEQELLSAEKIDLGKRLLKEARKIKRKLFS